MAQYAQHQDQNEQSQGILHVMKWRRVVLDEAQHIKNPSSRTSKACRAMKSKYRWAISGNPVQNGFFEVFSYFDFLNMPGMFDIPAFNKKYKGDHAVLGGLPQKFMIRRTHATTLLKYRMVNIPACKKCKIGVELKGAEQIFESNITAWVKKIAGMLLKKELDTPKRRVRILSIILRSRQMDSHFFAAAHFFPLFGDAELLRQFLRESAVGSPTEQDIETSAFFIEKLATNAKAEVTRILEVREERAVKDDEVLEGLISGIRARRKSVEEMQDGALHKPFKFEKFNG